jgi:hypothetical protein
MLEQDKNAGKAKVCRRLLVPGFSDPDYWDC